MSLLESHGESQQTLNSEIVWFSIQSLKISTFPNKQVHRGRLELVLYKGLTGFNDTHLIISCITFVMQGIIRFF